MYNVMTILETYRFMDKTISHSGKEKASNNPMEMGQKDKLTGKLTPHTIQTMASLTKFTVEFKRVS